ncbi:Fatty acid 2-hydroxylase [Gracilariopsis chorda]|uniref:Fatty acid 2-hydroxylase n=1 Tax=Gracilariopsis chorda TaxID=448386 RepID=A0A2V3IGG7_9FLOR|nr:Fatty acid 2-hydroxylase [Gracilariopsis chorda]|eukprot:PXF41128.1 Fatty acid 2-hydroxylase [Gracilariopsis chorda]
MCQPETLRKRTRTSETQSSQPNGTTVGYALTTKVVSHHNTPNDAWVIYKGTVYDITLFLESHPGGADVLHDKLGTDITSLMQGEQQGSHTHSPFAYKLLAKYKIGHLVDADGGEAPDGNVDPVTGEQLVHWDQPILHQVGMLGEKYYRWIHSFPTTDHTVKMFTNDMIENLTKCPWYVPLVFWLPIMAFETAHYIHLVGGLSNISIPFALGLALLGSISWLLFEYSLHRFVFHMRTTGYYSNIFHFLIHGHHHITPMDFDRLVFPPVPALIVASPFWSLAPKLLGAHVGYPWLLGFAFGYLVYDMTHFWIHHAVPRNSFLKSQKRRHVHHHYFQHNVNYGISNPLFDYVFNTISEPS